MLGFGGEWQVRLLSSSPLETLQRGQGHASQRGGALTTPRFLIRTVRRGLGGVWVEGWD